MLRAIQACRSKSMGYLKAGKTFSVPPSTLRDRVKNKNKFGTDAKKFYGKPTVLSIELEKHLEEHILKMEQMLFGITADDVRILAYQLAESNKLKHNFSKSTKRAGRDWLAGFLKRHRTISIRQPEATSAARATGFNKPRVEAFL